MWKGIWSNAVAKPKLNQSSETKKKVIMKSKVFLKRRCLGKQCLRSTGNSNYPAASGNFTVSPFHSVEGNSTNLRHQHSVRIEMRNLNPNSQFTRQPSISEVEENLDEVIRGKETGNEVVLESVNTVLCSNYLRAHTSLMFKLGLCPFNGEGIDGSTCHKVRNYLF